MVERYYVWKNKNSSEEKLKNLIRAEEGVQQNGVALIESVNHPQKFDSEEEAFESFKEYIGRPEVSETIQDHYTLVEVEEHEDNIKIYDLEKELTDMSDCPNCRYGRMMNKGDNVYECNECPNRELLG